MSGAEAMERVVIRRRLDRDVVTGTHRTQEIGNPLHHGADVAGPSSGDDDERPSSHATMHL